MFVYVHVQVLGLTNEKYVMHMCIAYKIDKDKDKQTLTEKEKTKEREKTKKER